MNPPIQVPKSASIVKASADDWTDSDSDDNEVMAYPEIKSNTGITGSFTPINGRSSIGHHPGVGGITRGKTGRPRGRPPKNRLIG